jgi:hypothetical protein
MRTQSTTLVVSVALALAVGCGSTRYRLVSSDHDVQLGEQVALSPVAHGATSSGDRASFDASLATALEDSTPDHQVQPHHADAPYVVHVNVHELRRDGARTVANTAVTVRDQDGNTVDELEIDFAVEADEGAAGAELGRRIGYYLTHREGNQL